MRLLPGLGILLALAFAACSDVVPPPGAAVSGTVWLDRNANGIRDACDPERAGVFTVVLLAEGEPEPAYEAQTGLDGAFEVKDVAAGEYLLTLKNEQPNGVWPVTFPDGDVRGHRLAVDGFKALGGLDIGVAGAFEVQIEPGRFGMYGVVFDDRDGDGRVSRDECGVPSRTVSFYSEQPEQKQYGTFLSPTGYYALPNLKVQSAELHVSASYRCEQSVAVPPSREGQLMRLNVAFQAAPPGEVTVTGVAFIDENENSRMDEGESVVPGAIISLQADQRTCLELPVHGARAARDGTFALYAIPPGDWSLSFYAETPAGDSVVLAPVPAHEQPLALRSGETRTLQLPFKQAAGSYVHVRLKWDPDGDWPPPPGQLQVCSAPDGPIGPPCLTVDQDYSLLYGPIYAGTYRVSIANTGQTVTLQTDPPEHVVTVDEGETVEVEFTVQPVESLGDATLAPAYAP